MITHRNLVDNINALNQAWLWTEADTLLHVLPLFHVHGLNVGLLGGFFAGSTIIMNETFDPLKGWQTIERYKCTMLMGVPTMYYRLLNQWDLLEEKPDTRSLRVFISGSAPLSENLFNRFKKVMGHRILERYGMTEAGMITTNPIEEKERKPGSVGFPFPGVQIRIADKDGTDVNMGEIGEICIQGSNVFKGYWQNPLKTKEAFSGSWLKSGDLGYQDPNDGGRLYIVGREKELIITGGYNVYPKEVERIIDQYKGVRESAVIGLPDDDLGEKVAAVIVLKKNVQRLEKERVVEFCKKKLAGYKCPKVVYSRYEIPRNAMGKIQKQILKGEYSKINWR
jgi:malonyl-CoA/methylmalonyl-CoA synthetase